MRFGTWNVTSLYRIGSLKTVVRELGKCKLDLVGVQEVRWEKDCTERAEDYTLIYGQREVFWNIRESYQQLGEWSLLVMEYCV
jgi:exonuclease III